MKWGFNTAANPEDNKVTTTEALRELVIKRLEGTYKRLDAMGVSAAFSRSARAGGDPVGDMGLIGSLIGNTIMWGAFMQGLEQAMEAEVGQIDAFDMANDPMMAAAIDGLSLAWDEKAHDNRARRKLDAYPQGRRKAYNGADHVHRKFNLVAANQNTRFSYDIEAEIACMHELLDMLDRMEKHGITTVRLNEKMPVYDSLKSARRDMSADKSVMTYAMPMRKVA